MASPSSAEPAGPTMSPLQGIQAPPTKTGAPTTTKPAGTGSSGRWAYAAGALVIAAAGVAIALSLPIRHDQAGNPPARVLSSHASPSAPSVPMPSSEPAAVTSIASLTSGEPEPVGTPSSAGSAGSAAPTDAEVAPGDSVQVTISIRPEGARVYYRGKEMGRSPFTLTMPRGERRAYEVAFPGYHTRKFVVDEAEREVTFKMRAKK